MNNQQPSLEKAENVKPIKTLNRVPRACNACRKQKMRCEGADNPPCKRCRNTGLECLFEKPTKEATLTGEAGLERIRSLETHVSEIRMNQNAIRDTLALLLAEVRAGNMNSRSPAGLPPGYHRSPTLASPSISTPTAPTSQQNDNQSMAHYPSSRSMHRSSVNSQFQGQQVHNSGSQFNHPQMSPSYGFPQSFGQQSVSGSHQGHQTQLPPFSSLQSMSSAGPQDTSFGPPRIKAEDTMESVKPSSYYSNQNKRSAPGLSNATSADSSDVEDDDGGDLPAHGLLAPLKVLAGLADVALEKAAREKNGEQSDPPSRVQSPGQHPRPPKRRRIGPPLVPSTRTFSDGRRLPWVIKFVAEAEPRRIVVDQGVISDQEARDLFRIFFNGCSTFLPVFDCKVDTYDDLHKRSPFAVNSICMVAARVRDGGGQQSETHKKILDEVLTISKFTLFSPVTRYEAVQSMILVSGWSDNGWLPGGHAVRMATELSMNKSWPRLRKRMLAGKMDGSEDRDLVTASRTWFCLYLFEHQLSYGTGRAAILKEDESIRDSRLFLQHPLAVEDDMRLVSTVELMAIRERINNVLAPTDGPLQESHFQVLRSAEQQFRSWFEFWDHAFSQKYEDAAFYRQSLQLQQIHAELYHNAVALTGINHPDDVQNIPPQQREVALRSINVARTGLDITVNSPTYRQGMKYAVNYTHATATFAASLLLRLSRLFPNECDLQQIRQQVESLANLMSTVPGRRYALTLQVMLKRSMNRRNSLSPTSPLMNYRQQQHGPPTPNASSGQSGLHVSTPQYHRSSQKEGFSPVFEGPTMHSQPPQQMISGAPVQGQYAPYQQQQMDAEHIWRGFESTSIEQLPVWISDQTLGANSLSQNGMDAFLVPLSAVENGSGAYQGYLPAPQIW